MNMKAEDEKLLKVAENGVIITKKEKGFELKEKAITAVKDNIQSNDINTEENVEETEIDLKQYKRRWVMLFLYVTYMLCNSSQWLQYSIISNIVERYYQVSEWHVNLTSLVMMICYIPLGLPAAYLMDKVSLRWTAIVGVTGTSIGTWIKVLSVSSDLFYLTLAGQTVVAISQVIMLSVPQNLSSTWFGPREVSSACSIGVFGFQLGIVVGFFLPPTMVKNHDSIKLIGRDLYIMFLSFAIVTTIVALLVLFCFEGAPPKPPTLSQARKLQKSSNTSYFSTLKRLFSQKNMCALFVLTGVNNGCFNGLSTLLSQIFLRYFPGKQEDAGRVGVTLVIFGMIASVIFGIILDRTKRFKMTLLGVYYMSAVAMLCFTFVLQYGDLLMVYAAAAFVGTFLCGFTAVSFDVATELTYPESELITGTIMNIMSLFFTILATLFFGWVNKQFGFFYGNLSFVTTLVLGATSMLPIRFELKRTRAQREGKLEKNQENIQEKGYIN